MGRLVNHGEGQYSDGKGNHINGLEGFSWESLKRKFDSNGGIRRERKPFHASSAKPKFRRSTSFLFTGEVKDWGGSHPYNPHPDSTHPPSMPGSISANGDPQDFTRHNSETSAPQNQKSAELMTDGCHSIWENMQEAPITEPKLKKSAIKRIIALREHEGWSLDWDYKKIFVGIFPPLPLILPSCPFADYRCIS